MTRRLCLKLYPHQVQHVDAMAETLAAEPAADPVWAIIAKRCKTALAYAEKRDAAEGAVASG